MAYAAARYYDTDTARMRWAVLQTATRCWYFPNRYGERAARQLARRLNDSNAG